MITYELKESVHDGHIVAGWVYRDRDTVKSFRHEFERGLPIGAVFDLLVEHSQRAHSGQADEMSESSQNSK